jgi:hypothetical protein
MGVLNAVSPGRGARPTVRAGGDARGDVREDAGVRTYGPSAVRVLP